jgi:hypothetical protein
VFIKTTLNTLQRYIRRNLYGIILIAVGFSMGEKIPGRGIHQLENEFLQLLLPDQHGMVNKGSGATLGIYGTLLEDVNQ